MFECCGCSAMSNYAECTLQCMAPRDTNRTCHAVCVYTVSMGFLLSLPSACPYLVHWGLKCLAGAPMLGLMIFCAIPPLRHSHPEKNIVNHLKMVVRPKHVADNLYKIVNNYIVF
jgi:hypothetical protein